MQFVTQQFIVSAWAQDYITVSLALCNHPHMVTTWACSYPQSHLLQRPSKMCAAKHLRQLLFTDVRGISSRSQRVLPAYDLYYNAQCDCQKNKNMCICMCGYSVCMYDTQTTLQMTKSQMLLCSTYGTRAGANRPVLSSVPCHPCHSQEHLSHLAICLDSRSLRKL